MRGFRNLLEEIVYTQSIVELLRKCPEGVKHIEIIKSLPSIPPREIYRILDSLEFRGYVKSYTVKNELYWKWIK